jgi:hypothetical protein
MTGWKSGFSLRVKLEIEEKERMHHVSYIIEKSPDSVWANH